MEARKICVVCGAIYRSDQRTCPSDGSQLVLEADQAERLGLGHVLGNYRLINKLGEGGVGTVYEAEHIYLGRHMALKVMHPETATDEVIVRFFNEARAVNQIRHPNIVDVEDFVTTETGEHYLIMELLRGEDLRTVLARDGVLHPARVSAIGEQIASALAAIHRVGIVHRDLKPDNIFLCAAEGGRETCKLFDFGIAKFLGEQQGMTREGMTIGTPQYIAPEQILSSGLPGPRADLYSLGMLLYECLAGAPAFTATTTAAILKGHISDPVVPPSHRRGEPLPAVLEAAVLKCLEKDPNNRFADGDELARALRADRAVTPATPRYVPPKTRRKSRALQMLPAFAMAAAAAVLHFSPRSDGDSANAAPISAAPVAPAPAHTPAPPAPPAPVAPAPAPAEPPPTSMEIALTSSPDGAEIFIGDKSLGAAPVLAPFALSSEPVTMTARFDDGTEVVQTIVPDRPLPQIAFIKPGKHPPVVRGRPTSPTSAPTSAKRPTNTITDRDGTMDPFK